MCFSFVGKLRCLAPTILIIGSSYGSVKQDNFSRYLQYQNININEPITNADLVELSSYQYTKILKSGYYETNKTETNNYYIKGHYVKVIATKSKINGTSNSFETGYSIYHNYGLDSFSGCVDESVEKNYSEQYKGSFTFNIKIPTKIGNFLPSVAIGTGLEKSHTEGFEISANIERPVTKYCPTGEYNLYCEEVCSDVIYKVIIDSAYAYYYQGRKVPYGISFCFSKERPVNTYKPACA